TKRCHNVSHIFFMLITRCIYHLNGAVPTRRADRLRCGLGRERHHLGAGRTVRTPVRRDAGDPVLAEAGRADDADALTQGKMALLRRAAVDHDLVWCPWGVTGDALHRVEGGRVLPTKRERS